MCDILKPVEHSCFYQLPVTVVSWLCACLVLTKLLLEVVLVHSDGYSCSIGRPQMLSCDHLYCKTPRALRYLFYHHCLKHQLQIRWLKGAYLSAFICTSCYQLVLANDKQY